jgi:peptidoglycan/LPS O-acetylase OafA/YrhL
VIPATADQRDLSPAVPHLPGPGSHIPALDGIRGLAVLMVMVCHFAIAGLPETWVGSVVHRIVDFGGAGVDLFFVLSGFLITGILYDARNQPHYFRNYYMRRALRIFPLYYGFLIFFFFVVPRIRPFTPAMEKVAERQEWLWIYGTNLIMAYEGRWIYDVDWLKLGHFWTLAIEEQFYMVWPFLVFFLSRNALIRVCAGLIVTALLLRTGLVMYGARSVTIGLFTLCRFDSLAIGALAAILIRGHQEALFRAARIATPLVGSAMLMMAVWRGRWSAGDPMVQTVGNSMLAFFFVGLLLMAIEPYHGNRIGQWFSQRWLMWFGTYSYALYVFHVPLMPLFERVMPVAWLSATLHSAYLGVLTYTVAAIAGSSLAAYGSWHLYEKHFLKLKKHFSMAGAGADRPPVAIDLTGVRLATREPPLHEVGRAPGDVR